MSLSVTLVCFVAPLALAAAHFAAEGGSVRSASGLIIGSGAAAS